jgi:putative restriction endonuclease
LVSSKGRGGIQHIFAASIKDRDGKCIICCIDRPELLQACHIKPFSQCSNQIEQVDSNNGITLCANHHKLFDRGLFTFDEK